jgi:hypothetical protein
MKAQRIIILAILLVLTVCCSSPSDKKGEKQSVDSKTAKEDSIRKADSLELKRLFEDGQLDLIDTIPVGDVNGDGKKDTAIILPHNVVNNFKLDSQYVEIKFTCNIPSIFHYSGFHGALINIGDLDGNNTNELLYWPAQYQSNDGLMYIYGFKFNKWKLFASGNIRADIVGKSKNELKFLRSRVKKINNKSFKFFIHSWCDGSIVDSAKIIKID